MPEFELPETPETPESHKERTVGLIIAVIAVVLAIVSHVGSDIQKEEIIAHVDATDQYAYYQAKKVRMSQLDLSIDSTRLGAEFLSPAGKAQATQMITDYNAQKEHLIEDADKIRDDADGHAHEAVLLASKASVLDIGETALQISIVLCSLTILTEQSLFVRLGMFVAGAGILVAAWVMVMMH